jgi:hypothetical protein
MQHHIHLLCSLHSLIGHVIAYLTKMLNDKNCQAFLQIRQGYSMSANLFILVEEVLACELSLANV